MFLLSTFCCSAIWGAPAREVKAISCKYASYLGKLADPCTIQLTAAAGSEGLTVKLASSSSEAEVPAWVKVAAGAASAAFTAKIVTGLKTEIVTIKATGGGKSATFALRLIGDQYGFSVDSSEIPFGSKALYSSATQSITLRSTGKDSISIAAAKVAGAGFSLKGASLPLMLAANHSVTWDIEFKPTTTGPRTGELTIISDSQLSNPTTVSLSGTGEDIRFQVDLSWEAPSAWWNDVAGYRIYRATKGSSSYELLNTEIETGTSYQDSTVKDGANYDYYIKSVNAQGVESIPSSIFSVSIP